MSHVLQAHSVESLVASSAHFSRITCQNCNANFTRVLRLNTPVTYQNLIQA